MFYLIPYIIERQSQFIIEFKMTSQNWLGTLNNPDVVPQEYLEAYITKHKAKYVVGQLEKGKEGTAHI